MSVFRNSVEKIKGFLFKSDKNNVHFNWRPTRSVLKMTNVPGNVLEKTKTQVLCAVHFFFRKSCPMWDNVEKSCTGTQTTNDNVIWRMRIECWIHKATKTYSEYCNNYCFSTAKIVEPKRLKCYFKRTLPILLWYA